MEPKCDCGRVKSDPEHAPDCAVSVARAPASVPGWAANLQRLPPRTEEAKKLRDALRSERVLVDLDYAEMEFRTRGAILGEDEEP